MILDKSLALRQGTPCSDLAAADDYYWLSTLRANDDRAAVKNELVQLMGVGPKVADCIALFSLDKTDLIPVGTMHVVGSERCDAGGAYLCCVCVCVCVWPTTTDTHIRQIAARFMPISTSTVVSPTLYDAIATLFRTSFPVHAGWAHSILFSGELRAFQHKLVEPTATEETATSTAISSATMTSEQQSSGKPRVAKKRGRN
jgi:N-glycosylase/DNA lyase